MTRGDGGQNLIGTEQGDAARRHPHAGAPRPPGASTAPSSSSRGPSTSATPRPRGDAARSGATTRSSPTSSGSSGRSARTSSSRASRPTATAATATTPPRRSSPPRRSPPPPTRSASPSSSSYVQPWQAKRLLWNAWQRPGAKPRPDAPPQLVVDLGAYDPVLGESYAEIAAACPQHAQEPGVRLRAETRHACPTTSSWSPAIRRRTTSSTASTSPGIGCPAARPCGKPGREGRSQTTATPIRRRACRRSSACSTGSSDSRRTRGWRRSGESCSTCIRACAGLWLEAIAAQPTVSPGSALKVTASAVDRSAVADHARPGGRPVRGVGGRWRSHLPTTRPCPRSSP